VGVVAEAGVAAKIAYAATMVSAAINKVLICMIRSLRPE